MQLKNKLVPTLKSKQLPGALADIYAAAVLVWFPWCANGYLKIAQTKLAAFLGITVLTGAVLAVVVPEKYDTSHRKRQGIVAVVYAAVTLVSTLLSGNFAAALWGSGGYLGGLVLTAAALLGCMGTAVFLKNPAALCLPFIISGAGVALLGVLNNFGVDPLGFRAAIRPEQYNLFFSTIGNADYLSAFLCLWLPLAAHRFAVSARAGEQWTVFACAEIGFLGMASLDSGMTALGLAGAAFVLLLFVPLTVLELSRYAMLAAGWTAAQFAIGVLAAKYPLLRTEHPFAALGKPAVAAVIVAVCLLAAAVFAALAKSTQGKTCLLAQRIVCGAAAVGCAVLLVLANAYDVSFGGLDNFLRFGPDWATGRGAIWADVWYCFTHGTPLQMLFGNGPGMVHAVLATAGDALPYNLTDTIGAHNEYLELLLTTGLAGLAAYLAFVGMTLHTATKQMQDEPQKCGLLFCAVAYLVQAFFNNRVTAVFPIFMVLLGVLTAEPDGDKEHSAGRMLVALVLTVVGALGGSLLLHALFL